MSNSTKKGFTLIELLVVIAIIGILSSVVLASLNSARAKSRDARRVSDLKQLQLAFELYFDSCRQYPAEGTGNTLPALTAATGCPSGTTLGTFLQAVPTPPNTGEIYNYSLINTTDYVLRADLEDLGHVSLGNDVDGTVDTLDCVDTTSGYYCVQP